MSSVTFDYDEFIERFVHIGQAVADGKLTEASVTAAYDSIASWQGADDDNSLYPYDPEHGILGDFPQSERKFYWEIFPETLPQ